MLHRQQNRQQSLRADFEPQPNLSRHDFRPIPLPGGSNAIRNPRLVRLHDYWRDKRGDRPLPSRTDVDPLEMKEWLGNLVLVEFFGDVRRFRIRLDGTNIVAFGGGDRTGRGLECLTSHEERQILLAQYEPVLNEGRPAYYETQFTNSEGRLLHEQKLLLPLSNDGSTVDMVLAGIYYENLEQRRTRR